MLSSRGRSGCIRPQARPSGRRRLDLIVWKAIDHTAVKRNCRADEVGRSGLDRIDFSGAGARLQQQRAAGRSAAAACEVWNEKGVKWFDPVLAGKVFSISICHPGSCERIPPAPSSPSLLIRLMASISVGKHAPGWISWARTYARSRRGASGQREREKTFDRVCPRSEDAPPAPVLAGFTPVLQWASGRAGLAGGLQTPLADKPGTLFTILSAAAGSNVPSDAALAATWCQERYSNAHASQGGWPASGADAGLPAPEGPSAVPPLSAGTIKAALLDPRHRSSSTHQIALREIRLFQIQAAQRGQRRTPSSSSFTQTALTRSRLPARLLCPPASPGSGLYSTFSITSSRVAPAARPPEPTSSLSVRLQPGPAIHNDVAVADASPAIPAPAPTGARILHLVPQEVFV